MSKAPRSPRIAVVHDWLVTLGGAERVLREILREFPSADLFAMVSHLPPSERRTLTSGDIQTSFIQRLPFSKRLYRSYIFAMPVAVEQFDLSGYDIVISSSYAVVKGVITSPSQLHLCYMHSPMRYAWDLRNQYLSEAGLTRGPKSWIVRVLMHYLRLWDVSSSNAPDVILANSRYIARRIRKVYRREAEVLHPPVDLATFAIREAKEDFYLVVSRLVPYKRVQLIVEAFRSMPDRKLVVIGSGPGLAAIRGLATENITVLGFVPEESVVDYMQRASALIIAAEEDFGITSIEAQACGTPVICFERGGTVETVVNVGNSNDRNPTGLCFPEQSQDSIRAAVRAFERNRSSFEPKACRANAERFSPEEFRDQLRRHIEAAQALVPELRMAMQAER